MALFSSRDFEELVQLQEFASFLHTGGIIKEQIDQVIQFLKSLNTIDDLKETDSPPLELSSTQKKCVRFEEGSMSSSHDHSVDFKPARIVLLDFGVAPFPAVQINDSMTWNALKMHIEDNIKLLRGHDEFMEVSCVVLRGQHFYTYDNSIISPDVIKDGDILTVEFQTSQTKGISRIISSGVTVRNKFQYLALSVHAFMLERGFFSIVDVVEHPVLAQRPWRRLPDSVCVRDNWDRTPGTVRMLYRHTSNAESTRTSLLILSLGGSLIATLSCTEYSEVELQIDCFVRDAATGEYKLHNTNELNIKLASLCNKAVELSDSASLGSANHDQQDASSADSEAAIAGAAVARGPARAKPVLSTAKATARPGPPRIRRRTDGCPGQLSTS